MRVLFAGVAALLLLATPMDEARAQPAPQVGGVQLGGYTNSPSMLDSVVEIAVSFDQQVRVTGMPQLVVEIGSQKRNLDLYAGYAVPGALYVGPRREPFTGLNYEYYVQASEAGSIVATGFDLNGGTITSAETGDAANLVFERTEVSVPVGSGTVPLAVDGKNRLTSPQATSCELRPFNWPQSGNTYGVDEEIQIAVFCTVALTVTGTPQVPLIIGSQTRYANYVPALSVASQPIFS